ncbi:hypothetical protein ASPZODRAFT_17539 [Penicilliopsis zonata CBS 506.65]|uniref:4Fe-4S ferredoxin-type domain-containing protein n=1 Tax=Penicilliopsis zonata CBS 506.65 TaxID=1073090 RepID=A0A1L9SDY4_9EURO|nr:hypothetical protein ASPZODRAFT_17539 [Penicilliopsis zonata CBS 506.65]OJJ45323.1 hypothetical protein ASPZODRAFT_17539 [Penicilliopsis zonata CBS 506.65]
MQLRLLISMALASLALAREYPIKLSLEIDTQHMHIADGDGPYDSPCGSYKTCLEICPNKDFHVVVDDSDCPSQLIMARFDPEAILLFGLTLR